MLSNRLKSILLTTCLTASLSLISTVSSYAAPAASYTVVSGDSLYKVSQVFGTTVDSLMQNNGLKSTALNIGQVLNVPCGTYTVQKGDTLYLIAQRYKISFTALQKANRIYSDNLNLGQIIVLPGAAATATSSNVSSTAGSSSSAGSSGSTQQDPAISYASADVDLLARLICAEAVGEPYDAKVAVGAVVINRVQSGLFADTLQGVIYQNINGYYQFTPVQNGWIDKPADTDSITAAKEALSGADLTKGALWYYDDQTTNQWMLSKQVSIKIGHMVYAY
jgi:N-acetylmuramoyl-L-alanine amidase